MFVWCERVADVAIALEDRINSFLCKCHFQITIHMQHAQCQSTGLELFVRKVFPFVVCGADKSVSVHLILVNNNFMKKVCKRYDMQSAKINWMLEKIILFWKLERYHIRSNAGCRRQSNLKCSSVLSMLKSAIRVYIFDLFAILWCISFPTSSIDLKWHGIVTSFNVCSVQYQFFTFYFEAIANCH